MENEGYIRLLVRVDDRGDLVAYRTGETLRMATDGESRVNAGYAGQGFLQHVRISTLRTNAPSTWRQYEHVTECAADPSVPTDRVKAAAEHFGFDIPEVTR